MTSICGVALPEFGTWNMRIDWNRVSFMVISSAAELFTPAIPYATGWWWRQVVAVAAVVVVRWWEWRGGGQRDATGGSEAEAEGRKGGRGYVCGRGCRGGRNRSRSWVAGGRMRSGVDWASRLRETLHALFDWPEQTQTSPNRTDERVAVLLPAALAEVAVMATPPNEIGVAGSVTAQVELP